VTKLSLVPIAAERSDGIASAQTVANISKLAWTIIVLATLRQAWFAVGRLIRFWRDYYLSMQELDCLSDHELRDLRVSRAQISRIAWDEARRRQQSGARQSFGVSRSRDVHSDLPAAGLPRRHDRGRT
jgi:uncharacterized protein YjiS (DUF1127 family)